MWAGQWTNVGQLDAGYKEIKRRKRGGTKERSKTVTISLCFFNKNVKYYIASIINEMCEYMSMLDA